MTDKELAQACAKSYQTQKNPPTDVQVWNVEDVSASFFGNVIAIPGTDSIENVFRDLDDIPICDETLGWCYRGFLRGAKLLLPFISGALKEPVYLTGHSLGGAMAVALGAALVAEGKKVISIVTFGAPRVIGAKGRSLLINSETKVTQYRNGIDIVPVEPPQFGEIDHVAPLTRIGKTSFNLLDEHMINSYIDSLS